MRKINLNKLKKNMFYKIISTFLIISSLSFLCLLFYIDLLPIKYSIIVSIVVLLFDIFNIFLISLKRLKKVIKKAISVFMIIATLLMFAANFYIGKTLDVLINNGDSKYKLEHYSVIVLKDSKYNKLKDIKGETLGYYQNTTGSKNANSKLLEKIDVDFKAYKTSDTLLNDLLDSKVNIIVVEDSVKGIMEEEITNFDSLTKIIYTFSIKVEVESTLKEVDVTKESFAIYISGIDTYGEITSVSRSDVNMVMVVNPKIHQILLISIPRDYYVQLHGTTGTKDKLTHAGIYGIDMSIQTIEDLLELDINYYIKVNFTSVIDIVNALGGVEVYSDYTFTSYSGFSFKKGLNLVNGEQALDFARTRKAFSDGDRQRGKNQQALIEALIRKATNKSIITKYSSLLNAINGKYQTNMSMKKITSLVKRQLNDMPSWNITSYSLTGSDSSNYTYTYNQLLYVMQPDETSVQEAIESINKVINGEKLKNSYQNLGNSSNKVTKIYSNKTTPQKNNVTENIDEKVEKSEQENLEITEDEMKDNGISEKLENGSNSEEIIEEENNNESDNLETNEGINTNPSEDTNLDKKEENDIDNTDPIESILPTLQS